MKKFLAFALALLCCTMAFAGATPCIAGVDTTAYKASTMQMGVTHNGAWVRWTCTLKAAPNTVIPVAYVGTVQELQSAGATVNAIMKSPNPLLALQQLKTLPLSDPSLAAIVADMRAASN